MASATEVREAASRLTSVSRVAQANPLIGLRRSGLVADRAEWHAQQCVFLAAARFVTQGRHDLSRRRAREHL